MFSTMSRYSASMRASSSCCCCWAAELLSVDCWADALLDEDSALDALLDKVRDMKDEDLEILEQN